MATAVVTPPADTLEQKFAKIESAAPSAGAEEVVPPPSTETPDTPPAAVPGQETPAEKPDEGVEETEVDLDAAPETVGDFAKYKHLFKDQPELRQILGQHKAYTEMRGEQPWEEFKQIHERVPTLADAERLVEESENAREFGRMYREDPVQFISSLKESDTNAFTRLVSDLPQILAKVDVSAWKEQAASYVDPVLNNLYRFATQEKNEALQQAVQLVAQACGITPGRSVAPANNPEVEELRRQLQEKNQAEGQQAFESFWSQTDNAVIENAVTEIEATLKKAAPNATAAQLKRMVQEVYQGTISALGSQPQFVAQMDSYRQSAMKGKQSISDHNAIVDFATKRAKLVIPRVARDIASEWNKSILQTSTATTQQKQAIAAKTKDVGAGPQATTSAAAAAPKSGKRTAADVWRELESGNYVKPAARV
jgi:polyhydroxyalkanoate synthesis regulator phasin